MQKSLSTLQCWVLDAQITLQGLMRPDCGALGVKGIDCYHFHNCFVVLLHAWEYIPTLDLWKSLHRRHYDLNFTSVFQELHHFCIY